MTLITGQESVAEMKRGSSNEKVGERNDHSSLASLGIHPRDNLADITGAWYCGYRCEDRLQVAAAPGGLLRRLGAIDAVLQFHHANRCEHQIRNAVLLLNLAEQHTHRQFLTFGEDNHAGVQNQTAHSLFVPDVADGISAGFDALLHISGKVLIRDRGVAELFLVGFGQRDAFADVASSGLRLLHDSNGPVIFPLNNDFVAALDPFQHRTNVANEFGFGDA
ncbi:MAG: hypothetical protein NTX13_03935 [Acidobacteria bacterium]|nr:hypothetical protein [Acidobacteriota bacterium]